MKTKVCASCKMEKPVEMFCKNKNNLDGLNSYCKKCMSERMALWRAENRNHEKAYREENKAHILQRHKKYREENRDKERERNRKWRVDNKEQISVRKKIYREENKEKLLEYGKQYRILNKDKVNVKSHRYRARKKQLQQALTAAQWGEIKRRFNHKCAYCGKEKPLEQEHFIPTNRGGEYTDKNIIPACRSCNASKRDSDFFEWYHKSNIFDPERELFILNYLDYPQSLTKGPQTEGAFIMP